MTSKIKVDNINKVSDDSNIIKKCGSTITVGSCGATVALASGATQTGFGTPSSSVLWCTTAKTSPFTAADKVGYFVNTSGGVVTVTLPASPSAGDVVAIKDYANTWDTNAVTLGNNGSKINGNACNAILNTKDQAVTLVFVDSTQGWRVVNDSTSEVAGGSFITATGGTILTCGDFKTHVFTTSGTFCVSAGTGPKANVSYLIVAGGGGGARGNSNSGGGGGAGGYREGKDSADTYTSSSLVAPAGLPVSIQGYPITIGGGGAAPTSPGQGVTGSASVFSSISSAGGGGAGGGPGTQDGLPGGSGGGSADSAAAGSGNTPPVSPPQGNNGGGPSGGGPSGGNGGGGAGAVGAVSTGPSPPVGGAGGIGVNIGTNFFGPTSGSYGTPGPAAGRYFAGGGGSFGYGGGVPCGSTASPTPRNAPGGAGGGGTPIGNNGVAGTVNTGGGGGGGRGAGYNPDNGGAGGSGFVAIRYKFQ